MKRTLPACLLAMISLALPLSAQTTPAPAAPATPATAPKTAVDTATDKAAAAANKATGKAKDAAKGAKDKADKATAAVKAVPFYGEVAAVDAAAKTVTIGENVYQVSATTVIHNADKPAKFEDVVVGKKIGGNYKTVEGKKEIVKLNVGVKQESAKPAPKAKADDKAKPAAPAPAADASKKKAA